MKQCSLFCFVLFLIAGLTPVHAQDSAPELSGTLDSSINYTALTDGINSFGFEEYANLRLRYRLRNNVIFNAAFNLAAMSGNYAQSAIASGTGVSLGENYAAALELERLYFRINGEHIDTEAGLLRMNFGYGNVWGSMDFLNPRNPLVENARPRGVLGINASFYPLDSLKLMGFFAAPKNPFESDGSGFIPGISLEQHWDRASLQALYALETGTDAIHRFGLSVKADIEVGFVADALYTLEPGKTKGLDGLSAGLGFDYSFLDGDLYLLFEYLFNGASSVTAMGSGGGFSNRHYLSATAQYRLNDFGSLALSTLFSFDDLSLVPLVRFEYELFQGFSLNCSVRVPLDLGSEKAGELGPDRMGLFAVNAGARLRF